jgi:predicted PurR-regulated permease PerM
MHIERHIVFWIVVLAVFAGLLWLLSPILLPFVLFAFGYLFGFVGLLLAVPLAAAAGVLIRFAVRRYRESPIYTGSRPV